MRYQHRVHGLTMGPLLLLAGLMAAGEAAAQSRPPGSGGPGSFHAQRFAQQFGASSSLSFSGVSVSVSPQTGIGVNIANLGASQTLTGWGWGRGAPHHPPGFAAGSIAHLPGFSGGSLSSLVGINGLNIQVGGPGSGPGGVSVNIANISLNNSLFLGNGYGPPRGHWPRHPRPERMVDTGGGGAGGGNGGDGGGGGGDGGGAY